MDIASFGTLPTVDPLVEELERYDLLKHVIELEAYGLTVVPPEKLGVDGDFVDRLRSAILRTCEQRNNVDIGDPENASPPAKLLLKNSWFLLEEDDAFVEAATNSPMLVLVRWLCGQSAYLSGQSWIIKPRGDGDLGLHSDAHGIPPGGGHIAHVCNASWLCTEYTDADDGPTIFAPGSHRYGRATLPHESDLQKTPFDTVPVLGAAGSLALWHGATWHGSVPRTKPGLRVTLVQVFMRRHMRPIHLWEGELDPALFDRFPELDRILGEHLYPYREMPRYERVGPFMAPGTDPFA